MKTAFLGLISIFLVACSAEKAEIAQTMQCEGESEHLPPPGSNLKLRASVSSAEGLEVIISDVVIPPGARVPRHFHPGEEFLYVIAGSAVHVEEGKPDLPLQPGDAYVIPPKAVHSPYAGPEGARAVVFRLHVEGQEERYLVPAGN